MFLVGSFSEFTPIGLWTLTLFLDGAWTVDWKYAAEESMRFAGTYSVEPVPIPAALPLLAAGLGTMGLMGWRRRKFAVGG